MNKKLEALLDNKVVKMLKTRKSPGGKREPGSRIHPVPVFFPHGERSRSSAKIFARASLPE